MTGLARIPWYKRLFGLGRVARENDHVVAADFARPREGRRGGGAAFDQGPVTTWRQWTPDLLLLAEMSADRGDLSLAAELCDALLADAFIASKLGERVRSLVGAPLSFVEGQGRRRGMAKRALEAGEDFWRLLPDAEYTQLVGWGLLLGAGLGQMRDWVPSDEHGGRLLPEALDVWHPRDLRFEWPTRRWLARDGKGKEIEVVSGNGQWFLFTPFGRFRPWVHGLWRQVARAWMLKNLAIAEWQASNQQNGARVITAQLPSADSDAMDDYTYEYRRRLVADLRAMGRKGVVALQPGLDMKLLEIGAESWESLVEQCKLCDEIVSVAFVGSSLGTSGDKAAYASSQTGQEVKRDIRAGDANVESTLVHTDVMVPWAHRNFNDVAAAPWPMRQIDPAPTPKELNEQLEGFGKAIKSLRDDAGLPVDAEEMSKAVPAIVLLSPEKRTQTPAPLYEYHFTNPTARVGEIRERLGWGLLGDDRDNMFPIELAAVITASLAPKPAPMLPPGGKGGPPGAPPAQGDVPPGAKPEGLGRVRYAKGGRLDGPALEGQLYADRLVDEARPLGPRAFRDVLVETLAAVESSKSYDEVRVRLLELAADADLEADARELLEHLAMMAWAGGAYEGARELEGGADA